MINDPSIDPANEQSLAGTLQFTFRKLLQSGVNGMLPCRVIKFDPDIQRVQVQILVQLVGTSGETIDRQQVASIPVLQLGGGGMLLHVPLKPGDLGWIFAADRDISNFLTTYANGAPPTYRMFSFSDGLFVPHVMTDYTISGDDTENMTLQTADGLTKISIGTNSVKVVVGETELDITPEEITVNGILSVSGAIAANGGITVLSSTGGAPIRITGDYIQTGNMEVIGNIHATGTITADIP